MAVHSSDTRKIGGSNPLTPIFSGIFQAIPINGTSGLGYAVTPYRGFYKLYMLFKNLLPILILLPRFTTKNRK